MTYRKLSDANGAAWTEGYDAMNAGEPETRNPYPVSDERHLAWNDGYHRAQADSDGDGPND